MSGVRRTIVLASTSPRRIELLGQAGFKFVAIAPDADETPVRGESARQMVLRLARAKADSVVDRVLSEHGACLVIGSDTTVLSPRGKILGKPRDRVEAVRMVASLAGATHQVFTGYSVLAVARGLKSQRIDRVVVSKVKMRKMPRAMVERYVDLDESMDKAGGYAVQGAGMSLIESISGSYTNVVGLPIAQLMADLELRFGLQSFRS